MHIHTCVLQYVCITPHTHIHTYTGTNLRGLCPLDGLQVDKLSLVYTSPLAATQPPTPERWPPTELGSEGELHTETNTGSGHSTHSI